MHPQPNEQPSRFVRIFFWLAGAGEETLHDCPNWERRKYVAFGATVLVPTVFAFMAALYCVSTLTDRVGVMLAVALVWSFIILTVDRALLTTYRAYQGVLRKGGQLALRLVVAALMGLTISHPLTLLLFRDTIQSNIEKDRAAEIAQARTSFVSGRQAIETRIAANEAEIATQRARWDDTYKAKFLAESSSVTQGLAPTSGTLTNNPALAAKIAGVTAAQRDKVSALEKEVLTVNEQATKVQGELDFWQKEFERELNGQRSGIVGLGPRAQSIQNDQIAWRRDETRRLTGVLAALTGQITGLRADIAQQEQTLTADAATAAQESAIKLREETERIAKLNRQVQQAQADSFVEQQNVLRATLKEQIDQRIEQSRTLQRELADLNFAERARIDAIVAEPRRDILTQTLALHKLFENGAQGGYFALIAYGILTLLFLLVDTIPLVVKFFSKPGPYDTLVDCDEIRFEKERETFLKSYRRYMDELSNGRLLHLTRNKPLEQALIEGVDRSRAAREFLEHLLDLEHTFNERILRERQSITQDENHATKIAMLEDMARTFYADLRRRMELFFEQEPASLQVRP